MKTETKKPLARLSPAVFAALFLAGRAGLLRAEEQKPLNGLHLADVQAYDSGAPVPAPAAEAVMTPPVPLDKKIHLESTELGANGKPRAVANPERPFSDSSASPVYQSWMSFFNNGTTVPSDLGDEWTLVGVVSFEFAGRECRGFFKKRCKVYRESRVTVNPDGLRMCLVQRAGAQEYPGYQKFTMNFTSQTVSLSDYLSCRGDGSHPVSVYTYLRLAKSVYFDDAAEGLRTTCRVFKSDQSKMICEGHSADGDWFERHTFFTIYSRDDGKDLLEPLPAILKPFASAPVTLKKSRPKN